MWISRRWPLSVFGQFGWVQFLNVLFYNNQSEIKLKSATFELLQLEQVVLLEQAMCNGSNAVFLS